MSKGLQAVLEGVDFLLSGKPDLTGLYFKCYKSEYNVSLRESYALQLILRSIQNQKTMTLDLNGC